MLEKNCCHYLCRLLVLFVLAGFSFVHSGYYPYYTVEAKGEFRRYPKVERPFELQKLFAYKATLTPKNDEASRSYGGKINVSVSALDDEQQQYMEVIDKGIKWTALVDKGWVTNLRRIADDTSVNSALASAGLSQAPQASQDGSSLIKSLMYRIYRKCLSLHAWSIKGNWMERDQLEGTLDFVDDDKYQ